MKKWPGNAEREITSFGGLPRSALMSRVRSSRNQTTELKFAALLRMAKLNGWRRNYPLIGKPDFVFPKARLVVFVDGCFWHGHDCGRNLKPKRNAVAWRNKISGNRQRDRRVTRKLKKNGWRVIRFWECILSKKPEACVQKIHHIINARRSRWDAESHARWQKKVSGGKISRSDIALARSRSI